MKKIFLAVFALSIFAQVKAQVKMGLRFAPQLTWSKHDNKNTSTNGTRVNVGYGLMLDYYFTENYAFGTEFTIQTMATNLRLGKDRFTGISTPSAPVIPATNDLKYNYRMQFVQIPLLLKMRTKEIGHVRYYAEFGLATGFLIKARADVSMDNFTKNNININKPDDEDKFEIEPSNFDDGVNVFRSGLIIGTGIQYNVYGNSLLVAGFRFDNGFTIFSQDSRWSATLNYVAINIGLLF